MSATDCNADLDHPCDSNDGEPCARCTAEHDYWRDQWELYGSREPTREEVEDAYSDPCERGKRDGLLRMLGL